MKLTDHDRGYRALAQRVFGMGRPRVAVGILEAQGEAPKRAGRGGGSEALTLIEVAIAQEFGTDTIPSRSFIRAWFDEHHDELRAELSTLMQSVVLGKRTKGQVLELIGQRAVAQIQKRIASGIDPPLAPATIRRKGSSVPLIDTGQLRSSVTYRIEEGGK